jgi:hypothetical protein
MTEPIKRNKDWYGATRRRWLDGHRRSILALWDMSLTGPFSRGSVIANEEQQ